MSEGFYDSQGFKVAAAVTNYDGDPNPIEDPEIGTMEFYLKYWGRPELGGYGFKKLDSFLCDGNDETWESRNFYGVHAAIENEFQTYAPKMKCLNEPFELLGNFNTD